MHSLRRNCLLILLTFFLSNGFLRSHGIVDHLLSTIGREIVPAFDLKIINARGCSVGKHFSEISKALLSKFDNGIKGFNLVGERPKTWAAAVIKQYELSQSEEYAEVVRAFLAAAGYVALEMPVSFDTLLNDDLGQSQKKVLFQSYCGFCPKGESGWSEAKSRITDYNLKVTCVFLIFLPHILPDSCFVQSAPWPISSGNVSSDDESCGPGSRMSSNPPSRTRSPQTPYSVAGTTPPGLRLSESVFGTPEKQQKFSQ